MIAQKKTIVSIFINVNHHRASFNMKAVVF
jgi:hypothetical protein